MTPQKTSGRWRNDEQRSERKGPTGLNWAKERKEICDGWEDCQGRWLAERAAADG